MIRASEGIFFACPSTSLPKPESNPNRDRRSAGALASRVCGTWFLVAIGSSQAVAGAETATAGGTSVPVFSITKSENKNQVQYVMRVDNRCAPVGPAPLSAYWRMLEQGPTQTAPILAREVRAYGLASQQLLRADTSGGQTRAVLMALPGRPITIVTARGKDGACYALATAIIAGAPAHIFGVYVHLKWDGLDYLLLQGWSMDGSHVVRETLKK
jgi:Domain of unknown function (DUF4833)